MDEFPEPQALHGRVRHPRRQGGILLIGENKSSPRSCCLQEERFRTVAIDDDDLPPIPFDEMWGSDRFWIPLLLANRHFVGRTDFQVAQQEEGQFKLLK